MSGFRRQITLIPCMALCFFLLCSCGAHQDNGQAIITVSKSTNQIAYSLSPLIEDAALCSVNSLSYSDDGIYAIQYDGANSYIVNIDTYSGTQLVYSYDDAGQVTALFVGSDGSVYFSEVREIEQDGQLIETTVINKMPGEGHDEEDGHDHSVYSQSLSPQQEVEGSKFNIYRIMADAEGRAFILWNQMSGERELIESGLTVLDKDGNLLFTIRPKESITDIAVSGNGVVYALMNSASLRSVDLENKALSEKAYRFEAQYYNLYSSGQNALYLSDDNSLYKLDLESLALSQLLSWLSLGLSGSPEVIAQANDNAFYVSTGEDVLVLKERENKESGKTTIRIATDSPYILTPAVGEFNKNNDTYELVVEQYSNENIALLNTQMMTGDVPDIFFFGTSEIGKLSPDAYVAQGLLADIYEFIDNDPELSRDSFLPNILAAREADGKMYQMPIEYTLYSLTGLSEVVGPEMGWTFEEMLSTLDKYPQAQYPFGPDMSQDQALYYLLSFSADRFIDWKNASCDFESQAFKELLQFAALQPEEWIDVNKSTPKLIADKEQLLYFSITSKISLFQDTLTAFSYKDITAIGFPTDTGVGNAVAYVDSFAISASSQYQDIAWDFLRQFLLDDYDTRTFPVNKASLERYLLSYKDDDIIGTRSSSGLGDSAWTVYYDTPTQEQLDALRAIIDSVSAVYKVNYDVFNIISEEASVYFSGDKTVEETCSIIQNRVAMYVSELK